MDHKIQPKDIVPVIDSKQLKILSINKDRLKNAIVFICLNSDKYNHIDVSVLRQVTEEIDKIEPSGTYLGVLKDYDIQIYDRSETRNRDLVITVDLNRVEGSSIEDIESLFQTAFPDSKSVTVVNCNTKGISS